MRVLRAIVCLMQHSVAHSGRQCKNFFEGKRWFLGGFLACILAGAAMSIQGVMNTRLGGHIGTLETNAFVQCTAAVLSLLVLLTTPMAISMASIVIRRISVLLFMISSLSAQQS